MPDLLNIWQVYFDEKGKKNCYPKFNHYDNSKKLTEHFENSVIADLIRLNEHKKATYFGVFSHDIRKDLVFREDGKSFSPKTLHDVIKINPNIDVFGFQKRRKQKNIVLQAENYHPGFVKMIETILDETGFLSELPKTLDNIILFNYFVAKSDVYERYVTELLLPAMRVLEGMPEAYKSAGYKTTTTAEKGRFTEAFGKPHWPYHPFILERLPSIFMQKYKYSFKHIF